MQETKVQFLGWEDPLRREMATHSPVLFPEESHGQRSLAGSEGFMPLLLSSPGMLALGRSPPSGTAFLPSLRKPCQKGLLITALLSLQQQPASLRTGQRGCPQVCQHAARRSLPDGAVPLII
ncbi:hypothetical protein DPEC_G00370250 [Dallia pectoralis]|nr:hypothetical protein DPEC_G00370250 [Dallia pectoralis]